MMTNRNVIWYKKTIFWVATAAIIAFIALIVSIILHYDAKSSDFTMSITPIEGITEKGGQVTAMLTIESQKYDSPIRLTTP